MKETDREAVATAVQRVAGMLQRPDQLDKVEQYRRREARKKASVEARLKAAIQSQLDGVRTGLSQLHSALGDVKDIQQSLAAVSQDWRRSISTIESLRDVKDAVVRHSQLAAAVENLKNIFSVPEIVRETQDLIEQGALLQAHRKLMDLECSRDGLMYEQYRMDSGNTRDMSLIRSYFGSTQGLSDELAKQLWMVLQRSLVTVRRDPTLLVSVVRIIEREEKIDRRILDRKKQTGFVPPGRPKSWKEKMFAILDRTVTTRIEGTQADTRESDRMWLVRHLEIVRKYVLDDLIVAKNLMVQCFPPHYEIFRNLLNMYHQALSTRMQELASEDLEANEIVSLLTWVLNTYTSTEMMGNPELAPEVDVGILEPLLSSNVVSELLDTYMSTLTSNIIAWLRKALETDKKDWVKETEPEADQDGYYQTTLPAIVFQMFEQNLQVAAQISEDLKTKVLVLCLQQMNSFLSRYKEEVQLYKEEHLRNRQRPHCYVHYMVAAINNCQTFKESVVSLERKYLKRDAEEGVSLSQPSMDGLLDAIAKEGCGSLLEEVFLDLEQHLSELMTKKWLSGSNAVDIICVTVEDYFNDFAKIKKPYRKRMIAEAHRRAVQEYLRAVMQKRISFRGPEERKEGAERMVREAEQLRFLFRKLASGFGEEMDGYCDTILAVAEVIKLTDPSLLYLEVSTLVSKYPDIRDDHIGALLAMRGDASRDMKQTIIETLEQGPAQASPDYVPIFKDIVVPSLNVAKLLK
ncbi:exocyst complex component 3 isoform X3 [Hippopotamus amphibius kiboko]|uniref:exocyst complex component 3 isoform X3 n=1 Tax=Hippopotamus amphibius kiboko TaxID=575201 RepID=UPI0025993A56|nr:exocyst complex component 3 isoform X3 [Hippopotamus amphibius kiboko]XP_057565237.1 exocyst complex component 3 isoform X3 [Hippopotamus amphibius kiboko]